MFYLTLLTALVTLISCGSRETIPSSQVSEEALHHYATVTLREGEKTALIEVQSRIGGPTGTTVRFEGASGYSINGQRPDLKNSEKDGGILPKTLGTYYSLRAPLAEAKEIPITYTNRENKTSRWMLALPSPFSFQVRPRTEGIRPQDPIEIGWQGSVLQPGEEVSGWFHYSNNTSVGMQMLTIPQMPNVFANVRAAITPQLTANRARDLSFTATRSRTRQLENRLEVRSIFEHRPVTITLAP